MKLKKELELIRELLERIAVAVEKKPRIKQEKLFDAGGAGMILEIWNSYKDEKFPTVSELTSGSTRYKNASARWTEKPDRDYWVGVIIKLNHSLFAKGDNDRGWVADFEFLVRPDNHFRILEGKYDRCHLSGKKSAVVEVFGYLPDGTPVFETKK